MEWLKDYEGGRGVAYLLAIVGMIAPTMLALFLFAQPMFLTMEWIKLLLLCASVGGLCIAICIGGTIMENALEAQLKGMTPISTEHRTRMMKNGLILGSLQGLLAQTLALVASLSGNGVFGLFLRYVFLIVLGFLLLSIVPNAIRLSWRCVMRKL